MSSRPGGSCHRPTIESAFPVTDNVIVALPSGVAQVPIHAAGVEPATGPGPPLPVPGPPGPPNPGPGVPGPPGPGPVGPAMTGPPGPAISGTPEMQQLRKGVSGRIDSISQQLPTPVLFS